MKMIFNKSRIFIVLLAIGYLIPSLMAQSEKPKYGFIRLVNAVSQGEKKLHVFVDGKDLYDKGYDFGDITTGMPLSPGSHVIVIKRDQVIEGTTKLVIEENHTTTIIPFAEKVPASDEKQAHWEIKILRLKQKQIESGRTVTFVSVSNQPEVKVEVGVPGGGWDSGYVKRLSILQMPLKYPESYAPVRVADLNMSPIQVAEFGNYVVVIYEDIDGKLKSINFQDVRFLTAD